MQIKGRIKPNTARMWDYVMGGAHNFAVDRAAVTLARKLYPLYEESMREQRLFLQRAMTYMVTKKGLDTFIDFGSGLPTRGNVHEVVQAVNPEAKVIYSDNDFIAVALGKDIVEDIPHVYYFYCDVENIYTLLNSPQVITIVGDDRRIGIGLIGPFVYVPDVPLAKFFDILYKWVDKGSYIAVACAGEKVSEVKGVIKAAEKLGLKIYTRSAEKIVTLIGSWKLADPGLVKGFYWGLPEDSPQINDEIKEFSYSFVAHK